VIALTSGTGIEAEDRLQLSRILIDPDHRVDPRRIERHAADAQRLGLDPRVVTRLEEAEEQPSMATSRAKASWPGGSRLAGR